MKEIQGFDVSRHKWKEVNLQEFKSKVFDRLLLGVVGGLVY